ncbi:mechanosensitive ion channel family protein [Neorhodopirellula pilleata]|uniref:Small-conductance mechanosensitive channel n=1 Tax=Neorhodopirellula pilleata TaxID=2714738 RepID=A0A5C6AEE4_9BACT|nr:mechanosensitive ion channel domain-containing protein [Neorhodopirellula pilleata]TWT97441.1 Small-conductance mechanosensitive channel [Neorhodopirellula pilleata]
MNFPDSFSADSAVNANASQPNNLTAADAVLETAGEETKQSIAEATSSLIANMAEGDFSGLTSYATTHLAPAMLSAAIGLFVIFLGYLAAKYLMRVISQPVCRRVDETLGKFVGKMVFYLTMFGVVGAVLSKLGAPLGGLAAMLAAAGFAIGLAFQGTLSNFAAGVLMLVFRPFKVGDFVTAAGVSGKVNEIDLFTTTLDTPDNRRIIVPNSSIAGGTIENMTHHRHRRVEVLVGVEYAADLQTTRVALTQAIENLSQFMIPGENRGCAVVLAGLGDSAVQWKVRLWVAAGDYWPVTEKLIGEVKTQLDLAGVGIPFPQMDIHIKGDEGVLSMSGNAKVRPTRRASDRMAG